MGIAATQQTIFTLSTCRCQVTDLLLFWLARAAGRPRLARLAWNGQWKKRCESCLPFRVNTKRAISRSLWIRRLGVGCVTKGSFVGHSEQSSRVVLPKMWN